MWPGVVDLDGLHNVIGIWSHNPFLILITVVRNCQMLRVIAVGVSGVNNWRIIYNKMIEFAIHCTHRHGKSSCHEAGEDEKFHGCQGLFKEKSEKLCWSYLHIFSLTFQERTTYYDKNKLVLDILVLKT